MGWRGTRDGAENVAQHPARRVRRIEKWTPTAA